ncbi:MAG: TolC family protein [Phycisphaerae bacterium]|nr:TolC family protein [Phycisphaerae bacterium]
MRKTIHIILSAAVICSCGCFRPAAHAVHIDAPADLDRAPSATQPAPHTGPAELPVIEPPVGKLTLQKALALALIHNPQLKSNALDIRIAEADRLQTSLRPNPELEFVAEEVGAGRRNALEPGETIIALSQLVELGGKRQKRIRVSELETRLAGMDYEARRLDVLTEVHTRFVELLAAQQRVDVMRRIEQLAEKTAATVDAQVDAGRTSPVEKTRAQIQLSDVRIQRRQADQNLDAARRTLAKLWAADASFDEAVGDFETTGLIVSADTMRGWIESNPDIARWAIEIEQRQAAIELEKARGIPDITLGGGVQVFDEPSETAAVFGARIALPLFDANQGGRRAAAYRLARAGLDSQAARLRIETRLVTAHRDAANALTRVEELRDHVLQNAAEVFEAMEEGYRGGKFEYVDLLDAQRTLFDARLQYIDALAEYHTARAELERLVGGDVQQDSSANQ